MISRHVYCEDALDWLKKAGPFTDCSFVASLPDFSEFPQYNLPLWKDWFVQAARLILSSCPDEGVTIFCQSDVRVEGSWVDKAYLCQLAADQLGQHLWWHKIVCRSPAGTVTRGRPAYSHLLCFSSQKPRGEVHPSADVLSEAGEKVWVRGMGLSTCLSIGQFILKQTSSKTVINPFCGQGSMLAVANYLGLEAIGIERSPKRAQLARELSLNESGRAWQKRSAPL